MSPLLPDCGQSREADLQAGIEGGAGRGEQLSMSTYRADSEISRFNALPVDEWFDVSRVLSTAMAVGWQSEAPTM